MAQRQPAPGAPASLPCSAARPSAGSAAARASRGGRQVGMEEKGSTEQSLQGRQGGTARPKHSSAAQDCNGRLAKGRGTSQTIPQRSVGQPSMCPLLTVQRAGWAGAGGRPPPPPLSAPPCHTWRGQKPAARNGTAGWMNRRAGAIGVGISRIESCFEDRTCACATSLVRFACTQSRLTS